MQRNRIRAIAVLCSTLLLGATAAQAATVGPVLLTLTPGDGIDNVITVNLSALGGVVSLDDTSTATGSLEVNLYGSFSPTVNVTGIGFIGHTPGTVMFTPLHYDIGTLAVDTTEMNADLYTPTPPLPVNGTAVPVAGHKVWLNGGEFSAVGSLFGTAIDEHIILADEPVESDAMGPDGSLTLSTPYLSAGKWVSDVTLIIPVQFSEEVEIDDGVSITISTTGSIRATGTMEIPEPGTLALLVGLAAGLAGYGLFRRRK